MVGRLYMAFRNFIILFTLFIANISFSDVNNYNILSKIGNKNYLDFTRQSSGSSYSPFAINGWTNFIYIANKDWYVLIHQPTNYVSKEAAGPFGCSGGYGVCVDKDTNVWTGGYTFGELRRATKYGTNNFFRYVSVGVFALCANTNGDIWLGGGTAFVRVYASSNYNYEQVFSEANYTGEMAVDRDGNVWGTFRSWNTSGEPKYVRKFLATNNWQTYITYSLNTMQNSIAIDRDNNVWFAGQKGQVGMLDSQNNYAVTYYTLSTNTSRHINSVVVDANNDIYASLGSEHKVIKLPYGSRSNLVEYTVADATKMAFDNLGNLWITQYNSNAVIRLSASDKNIQTRYPTVSGSGRQPYGIATRFLYWW